MKIQGIGLPFSVHQSSCSNRTPKNFEWTLDDAKISVVVDNIIFQIINEPIPDNKKRFGWICESRAILPKFRSMLDAKEILDGVLEGVDAIFTCEKELVHKHEKIHFCLVGSNLPWIKEYKTHNKSKLISFIASKKKLCCGHELRHTLYEKVKNNVGVDVYGSITGESFGDKVGCHIEGYPEDVWHDKSEALNDYMFSIVIENDKYDTYFTEKITDCFATGTIPIYYGSKSIGEYFNTDGIVFIDNDVNKICDILLKLTPEIYYSKMSAIEDNLERVKNMQLADDMLYEKIMEVGYDTSNSK